MRVAKRAIVNQRYCGGGGVACRRCLPPAGMRVRLRALECVNVQKFREEHKTEIKRARARVLCVNGRRLQKFLRQKKDSACALNCVYKATLMCKIFNQLTQLSLISNSQVRLQTAFNPKNVVLVAHQPSQHLRPRCAARASHDIS